ncbi:uncharacterized protein BDZ99DRAFT_545605, partial [Mytilinidion resinicola]
SPYTGPALTFLIGSNRVSYTVPELYARQSPKWAYSSNPIGPFGPYRRTVELPEVDEDIGHTLVHYLYTGTYQTLKPRGVFGTPKTTTEYRRGFLVYYIARLYGLDGLAEHAIKNMEMFDQGLSIFEILDIARDLYPKFLKDENWLLDYLKTKIEAAFEADETIFAQERFFDHIGEAAAFNKALVKIMVGIYTDKITSLVNKEGEIRESIFGNPAYCEAPVAEESVLDAPPPPPPPPPE